MGSRLETFARHCAPRLVITAGLARKALLLAALVIGAVFNAAAWEVVHGIDSEAYVSCLAGTGDTIYAGTLGQGIFRCGGPGTGCSEINQDLGNLVVYSLAMSNGRLLAGTDGGGVYVLDHSGVWRASNNGLADLHVFCLATLDTVVFAGTWRGGLFRSADRGQTWNRVHDGFPQGAVYAVCATSDGFYAAVAKRGVFRSPDGIEWQPWGLDGYSALALKVHRKRLFAGTWSDGLYWCALDDTTWTQSGPVGYPVHALDTAGQMLIASRHGSGLYQSHDFGETWEIFAPSTCDFSALHIVEKKLFAGTLGCGLVATTRELKSWRKAQPQLIRPTITARPLPPGYPGRAHREPEGSAILTDPVRRPPTVAPVCRFLSMSVAITARAVTIEFDVSRRQHHRVAFMSPGRLSLRRVVSRVYSPGKQRIGIGVDWLGPGIHVAELRTSCGSYSRLIALTH